MKFNISKIFLASGLKDLILWELSKHPENEEMNVYVESYQNVLL